MSQFIEMFNGEFPMERWEECLTITNGKKYDGEYQETGTYPICGSGGIMGYANDWLCPENCVIIGRKGNINKPIYVTTKFWNVDTAFGLNAIIKCLFPKFLFYFCHSIFNCFFKFFFIRNRDVIKKCKTTTA